MCGSRCSVEIGVSVVLMATVVSVVVVVVNGFHIPRGGSFIIIQEEHCHEYNKHDEG